MRQILPPENALAPLIQQARDYAREAVPDNTRHAYRADWKGFTTWCEEAQLTALPATTDTVVLYLTALAATHRVSSLRRKLASISSAHQLSGHESPTRHASIRLCLRGIARRQAEVGQKERRADPLLLEDILGMIRCADDSLQGKRDTSLLLLGFAGGFRRSELVALQLSDLTWSKEGIIIHLRRSKTDQTGNGQEKAIPHGSSPSRCPVPAMRVWLEAADISEGPVFRRVRKGGLVMKAALSAQSVSLIIRKYAARAGIPGSRLSGHSLRSGFVTAALLGGASYPQIQKQTGHRSLVTVTRYERGRTQKLPGHQNIETTMLYTHVQEDHVLDVARKASL